VTANGATQFVEKMTKFGQEMQVHYAHFGVASGCKATVAVTVNGGFNSYTLSPKSRMLSATKNGDTLTFDSGPNYLILQIASKELLFVLIDDQEVNPPKLGDAGVKNLADYDVDNTGAALVTSKVQAAIDAASGSAQNILYVPPGRYKTGEVWLKSNMTLYLAAGAILDGSTSTGDYSGTGAPAVENTSHGVVHMNKVSNTKILGRGVIDGNGSRIRGTDNDTPSFKINTLRIDDSTDVLVDGIVVRDPVFWNTLIFDSDKVTIQNFKVINRRPTTTAYNQTDGVDFDCSTNGKLYNAFIYSGDDSMSPKREQEGKLDTKAITYEKVVAYSNSAATKIGTKTYGQVIEDITFKDIDVVKAGRALGINADDTAVIQNITWQDVRVETVDGRIIDFEEDATATWRNAPNRATVKEVFINNVASAANKEIYIHGKSSTVNFNGIHFDNFTVQGNKVTSRNGWNVNQYVSNITFK
jgi:polygalacturonase